MATEATDELSFVLGGERFGDLLRGAARRRRQLLRVLASGLLNPGDPNSAGFQGALERVDALSEDLRAQFFSQLRFQRWLAGFTSTTGGPQADAAGALIQISLFEQILEDFLRDRGLSDATEESRTHQDMLPPAGRFPIQVQSPRRRGPICVERALELVERVWPEIFPELLLAFELVEVDRNSESEHWAPAGLIGFAGFNDMGSALRLAAHLVHEKLRMQFRLGLLTRSMFREAGARYSQPGASRSRSLRWFYIDTLGRLGELAFLDRVRDCYPRPRARLGVELEAQHEALAPRASILRRYLEEHEASAHPEIEAMLRELDRRLAE